MALRTIGVALPIPEPYGSELRRFRASFGDAMAASIPTHVTLLPPTDVNVDDLPAIEQHLKSVAADARRFRLHLRGTATFRPVSPVVFIVVIEGIAECEMLSSAVRSGPLEVTLSFPYHPHVTVAHHLDDKALDRAFAELSLYECIVDIGAFALYEHGDDGVWRPQREFALGGPLPAPVAR